MYFEGPWTVVDQASLAHSPRVGQVARRDTGVVVLRCPECRALQFAYSPISGPDDKPTLAKPIQCGAGHCKRCGIWFSIVAGKTIVHDDDPREKPVRSLPKKLTKAGVHWPPKVKVETV